MTETESAGGVIVNESGEIALVSHGDGAPWWGFPKGHIDAGEDALTAAKREIAEETGLTDIILVQSLGSYKRHKGGPDGHDDVTEMKTIHMFLFTSPTHPLMPGDPHNPEARWVATDDVSAMLAHPLDRAFFEGVLPEVTILRSNTHRAV